MEKSTVKTSKESLPTSSSSDNGRRRNYTLLARCNSFSSCSNDSSLYGGNNPVQTRLRNGKRTIVNQSVGPRKRTRNSSGSSISSSVSVISDKDLKSAAITSETVTKIGVKSFIANDSKASQLNHSKINSNNIELKEETIINEEVDCSKIPNRHNLRGKITKKGCTCCPSTCATVVLRRYKRYVKSGEEKTVISSTKVKTYVQKNSPPSISQVGEENDTAPCSKSRNRKRKSEIEKLYESLHEIEWAKNFSPDNILRQISVRQAAACSVFGHSQINTIHFPQKIPKKQKIMFDVDNEVDSPKLISSEITSENMSKSCEIISNVNKDTHSVTSCDKDLKIANLQNAQITTSNIYHCKQNCNSSNPHSPVNTSSCSMSHINVKEISFNSRETLLREPLVMENGADFSDDAQLSYTSDESSSAISSSIVSLQSKHVLGFSYKGKNNSNLSDTDASEYSSAFFDIAEEGIRTIDACFREVGAEVVVSTCYEEESSLPLLTSVRENRTSNKVLNENPPILEPCIDIAYNRSGNSFLGKHNKQLEKKINKKSYSKTPITEFTACGKKCATKNLNLHFSSFQSGSVSRNLNKSYESLKVRYNAVQTARKIVKKYLKLLQCKSRLKLMPITKSKNSVDSNKLLSVSGQYFPDIKMYSDLDKTKNSVCKQNSVFSSTFTKSHVISCKMTDTETNKMMPHKNANNKYSSKKTEDVQMRSSIKNASHLYESGKTFKYPAKTKEVSIISETHRSNTSQSKSSISSFMSKTIERDSRRAEHISRPLSLYGFSGNYRSIRVNRSYNYTHVILLVTRGKSIFLTLEVLTELRDALIRSNSDSNCQVLIINGVGDSFCSGLDLKPLVGPRKKIASNEIAIAIKELIEALSDFKKPLAAVVNGPALGLGMTLLNHADLTIASDKATFCMPYSYLGYMPEGGATLTLPQVVGSTVAMDLLLRGKTLTAREACNVGLISEVLEARRLPQELVSRVRALAENSLSALETTKALLKMQLHINLRLVLENEVKLLPRMWLTRTCQDSLRKALESGILSG